MSGGRGRRGGGDRGRCGGDAEEWSASGGAEEEGDERRGWGISPFLRGKQKRGQPLETVDFTDMSTYAT
jgi:hypothetical protein